MKKLFTPVFFFCSLLLTAQAPFSFTNSNSKFTSAAFHSGNCVSVVDMNGDGMDDMARLSQGTDVYYTIQRTNQTFNNIHAVSSGLGAAWGMVVADVDNNGVRDVAIGSGSQAKVVTANTALTTFSITANLPKPSTFFPQNMNFADVDNDGMVDLFVCNDDAAGVFWKNVAGAYPATTNFFSVNNPGTDNSGNYGSIWTDIDNDGDIDFYIAHCRQGTPAGDARRLDQLFINDGAGNFTLDAANARGLRNTAMTWTASFDDIDNDGDLDCILTETDKASELFLNDGNGYFTDATAGSGFVVDITPYQSKMEDLDNDGFVDIIISGDDSRVFHNNHDHTFTLVSGLFDNNAMLSFATGDLNHDGKIDLYSSYGTVYNNPTNTDDVLWLNSTNNGNHFVTFNLQGTVSNRDALGARVEIYGAWGKQIREVRAGESYGTTNSFQCHFGLGTATTIDSVIVRWPKGLVTHIANPAADQFITVIEGQCYSADNVIAFNGPTALCAGQTVTMSAPLGYSYLWSNGDTTQTLAVSTTGEFNVKLIDGSGCSSLSKTVTILSQPDETPTVTPASTTVFCEGDSVLLQGSTAASYLWSNGATSQNIYAKDAGTYTLTIQGTCAPFTSSGITLAPIASHVANIVEASTCEGSGATLTLTATTTGTSYWYDDALSGTLINTGTSYTTPAITSSTTYYVESHDTLFGLSGHVGPADNSIGAGASYTGDQAQIFDVVRPCVLRTVTVFSDSVGVRVIQLRDNGGNVLQTASVNILSGTYTIPLNFNLTPGTNYRLGWLAGSKPHLYRNSSGANYPYTLNNLVTVTGNTASDPVRWYAYYNWFVEEEPITCSSTRTPVTATVNPNPTVSLSGLNASYLNTDATVTVTGTPSGGTFTGAGVTGTTFDPATAGVGGPYTVSYSYTDGNGCSATTSFDVTVLQDTTGVGFIKLEGISGVSVYPNPNSGSFAVTFKTVGDVKVDISLTNEIGQKIFEEKNVSVSNSFVKPLQMEQVAKGIYQLNITSGKQKNTYKVIIQ